MCTRAHVVRFHGVEWGGKRWVCARVLTWCDSMRGMGWKTRDGWPAAYLSQRPAAGAMHRRDVTLGVSAPTSATGAGKPRRLLAWRMGPKGRSAANWARQPRRASERIASAPTAKFARLARHFGREETADFPSSPRFPLPTPMPNFHSAQGRPDNSRPPRRRSRRRKGRRVRSCSPSLV